MFEVKRSPRVVLWEIIILLAVIIFWLQMQSRKEESRSVPAKMPVVALSSLRTGDAATISGPVNIVLNEPVELDYLTRAEVMNLRKEQVLKYPEFVDGEYRYSPAIFGQIVDNRPWWGLVGQYCKGPGQQSIDGASEETRYLMNPYLLLGISENDAWDVEGACSPLYPRPVSLIWEPADRTATVTYDFTRYFEEWNRLPPRKYGPSFYLVNYNARDFGYNYIALSNPVSYNIESFRKAKFFEEPVYMQAFIHLGGSCGFPGGCNNQSPTEPDINFWVKRMPARMACKLWKEKPKNINEAPDFTYIIQFK